jgi:hypothetical protein
MVTDATKPTMPATVDVMTEDLAVASAIANIAAAIIGTSAAKPK